MARARWEINGGAFGMGEGFAGQGGEIESRREDVGVRGLGTEAASVPRRLVASFKLACEPSSPLMTLKGLGEGGGFGPFALAGEQPVGLAEVFEESALPVMHTG